MRKFDSHPNSFATNIDTRGLLLIRCLYISRWLYDSIALALLRWFWLVFLSMFYDGHKMYTGIKVYSIVNNLYFTRASTSFTWHVFPHTIKCDVFDIEHGEAWTNRKIFSGEFYHIGAETKLPLFSRRHFQTHFLEWTFLYFDQNFIEICSQAQYFQVKYSSIGSESDLAPVRRQAIIWTNDGLA